VTVHETGTARPLGGAVELAAYRIIQESLTNVARHAPGATVTIDLAYSRDGLELRVCDDGRHDRQPPGDAAYPLGHPGSGIAGMRERADALGGSLDVHRRVGGGFEVAAQLPAGAAR
jgi:signal transduction histidine kinase